MELFHGVKELKELRQMPYCLKYKKKAVVLTLALLFES